MMPHTGEPRFDAPSGPQHRARRTRHHQHGHRCFVPTTDDATGLPRLRCRQPGAFGRRLFRPVDS
eukprot:6200654-Pyramimonas_sp.AAC.1